MENIKNYSCLECKYFAAVDPDDPTQGFCRRFAPHALDFHGCQGGGDPSPLTAKGDIYTRDATDDTRQPVGTDGQILSANSAESTGLEWIDPPSGSSPLTTKGDLYAHNGTDDARQAVGTDGQVLIADSSQPNGLRWADPGTGQAYLDTEQAALFVTTQQTIALFTHDGEDPGSGTSKAISNPNNPYDTGGSYPFIAPYDAATVEIVAFQVCVTACAVGGSPVGPDPYINIQFYENNGAAESLIGTIAVPVDPLKTGTNNNTGTPNFQNVTYVLPTPISINSGAMFGWRADLVAPGSTEKIAALRNTNTKVYLAITPTAALVASPAPLVASAEPEAEPGATVAASLAAPIPIDESTQKWALIQNPALGWCGEFAKGL